jgi:hypothetical protein
MVEVGLPVDKMPEETPVEEPIEEPVQGNNKE